MKLTKKEKEIKVREIIVLIVLAMFLRSLWLFSLIERDEGIFGYSATRISRNDWTITDNKLPLINFIYAIGIKIHNFFSFSIPEIMTVRMLNNITFLFAVMAVYLLFIKIKKELAFFSTLFFILFMNTPAFEGHLAMTESFGINFFIFGIFFLVEYLTKNRFYLFAASIFFLLISSLLKYPFFFLSGYSIFFFIYKQNRKSFLRKICFFIIAFLVFASLLFIPYILASKENVILFIIKNISSLRQMLIIDRDNNLKLVFLEGCFFIFLVFLGFLSYKKSINREKEKEFFYFFRNLLFISVFFSLIPPCFGHYFLTNALSLSFFSALGIYFILNMKKMPIKYFLITLMACLLAVSFYVSSLQYPNMNFKFKSDGVVYNDFLNVQQQIEVSRFLRENIKENESFVMCGFDGSLSWLSKRHMSSGVRKICYPNEKAAIQENYLEKMYRSKIIVYDNMKILNCDLPNDVKYLVLFKNYYDDTLFNCTGNIEVKYDNLLVCKCK